MTEKRESKLHDDGTVTYWSQMQQCWIRRTNIVPEGELYSMPEEEQERITRHLETNWSGGGGQ